MNQKRKSKIIIKSKNKKREHKNKAEQPKTWKQWLFVFTVGIFVLITIYVLLFSRLTRLQYFNVNNNDRVNKIEILNIVENSLNGNFFGYIKKDNYFLANKKNIINNILQDKRIKNITITKKFPQTLNIVVEEYQVIPIWCTNNKQNCFIIEDDIIKQKIKLSDEIVQKNKVFIMTGENNKAVEIGEEIISDENLKKIATLGEELVYVLDAAIQQPYIVASRGSNEVRFITDEGWYVNIDLTQDVNEVLNVAKLFIKNVELPGNRSDLEYVDMRFPEKIFYKMKNEVEPVKNNEQVEKNVVEQKDTVKKDEE